MNLFESVVLGVVQGLTEFLPISSTAHLRILPALVGWEDPGAPFTAVTQIGTLIAVLIYFRHEVVRLSRAFVGSILRRTPFESHDSSMAWWILFGTIPIVIAGLVLKDAIETHFRSLWVISGSLIVLALLLWVAEKTSRFDRPAGELRLRDVLLIGLAQAVALVPGASRSGTTMTMGMFLHLSRETAASFSFLLSIPAVALSGVYQLYKLRAELLGGFGIDLLVATVVAGVVGYASIALLLAFLRRHSTGVFILYRIALGIALIALLTAGILTP